MTSFCFPWSSAGGRLAGALLLCVAATGCASLPPAVPGSPPPPAERGRGGQDAAPETNDSDHAGDRGGPGAVAGPSESAAAADGADGPGTAGPAMESPAGPVPDGGTEAAGPILAAPFSLATAGDPAGGSRPAQEELPRPPTGQAAAPDGSGETAAPPDPKRSALAGQLVLALSARPAALRVGEVVTVEIRASSPARVVDAPLHLLYDAVRLRFVEGAEGDYLKRDGSGTVFLVNGRSQPGVVTIGLGRTDRAHGLSGAGTHCRVRFQVMAPGVSRVAVGRAMAWADDGSMLPVATAPIEISVP